MLLSLAVGLVLTGCNSVQLSVHNPNPIALNAWVEVLDGENMVHQRIDLGLIPKNQGQTETRFKINPGFRFELHAVIPATESGEAPGENPGGTPGGVPGEAQRKIPGAVAGTEVFRSGEFTVTTGSPNPFVKSISLDPLLAPVAAKPQNPVDISVFADATREPLPVWENFQSLDANEGARRFWGALLVVLPPDRYRSTGKILYEVPASVFSSVRSLNEYPKGVIEGNALVSAAEVEQLRSGFPGFSAVLGKIRDNEPVMVTWKMQDYGWSTRVDDEEFQVLEAIWGLPERTKRDLLQILGRNPDAHLMYVSRIYVVKQMTLTANHATRLNPEDTVDVDCVITDNGIYRFDPDQKRISAESMKVVNVRGLAWVPRFARVNHRATGYEFIDDPRLDLIADDFVKNRVILLPKHLTTLGPGTQMERMTVLPDLKALEHLVQVP